ncbi:hypothetical protein ON010_g7992 [Phytophthora cinnamomi]|nr:hypothetical protein ON010_g7992 [Phytophthora cinnamomi]
MQKFTRDGPDQLLVIADFDHTLTPYYKPRSDPTAPLQQENSSHGLLMTSRVLQPQVCAGEQELFARFYPVEMSPTLSAEEKLPFMEQWWNSAHALLVEYKLTKAQVQEAVALGSLSFRQGFHPLLKLLHDQQVPTLVFSAGLYDVIHAALEKEFAAEQRRSGSIAAEEIHDEQVFTPANVHVVSNMMRFDAKGVIEGFDGRVIHPLTKTARALLDSPFWEACQLEKRRNVLLLGDSRGDVRMADGLDADEVLRVGFLNVHVDEALDEYLELYDVVFTHDASLLPVQMLIEQMTGGYKKHSTDSIGAGSAAVMTAHNTKGTAAVMNPSIPPAPESPVRKTSIPDKTSPRHKQQQVDGVPPTSKSTSQDQEKQQQQRAPERVTDTAAVSSTSAAASSSATTSGSTTKGTANSSDDSNGDVIGEYVLGETIGKGTFGKVKLGLHLLTGEKVAVKILEKKRIVQAADVERVAREIKILKRNRHQNVIQLYEVIDSPDRIFLIMEHVDGGEMFEYIVAHHRIREPEAAFLFRQIVDGLAYLHSNEITHRDLKPENLLLQSNRNHNHRQQQQTAPPSTLLVKIVDFGLSNIHDGGRLLRTACGSPCYAAPEMIQGRMYHGPIADMWSLGVVLFAMVCGFLPFEDSNTNLLYKKILSANYKMPTFLSANAQDLIRRILETDPEKRYTVDKIRQHPWLAGVQTPELSGYDVGEGVKTDEIKARHELVLNQLESLGLPKEEVQAALSKKAYNRFTASYYLLDGKLQRIMKTRIIPMSTSGNSPSSLIDRPVRRESNTNTEGKHQDRQDAVVRSGGSDIRITGSGSTAGSGKNIEVTGAPHRQNSGSRSVHESPRRKSNPHHHHPPHLQQHGESPYARRAVTPSNVASPRHSVHHDASAVTQRPSSVRGGRNLVMINNGTVMSPAAGFLPVAPNPPRDPRHSGILTARKPQGGNTRVTISNGMVALRPLAQPVHPPRRELLPSPQSATRRHSSEVPHGAPSFHHMHDPTPTHIAPVAEPPSRNSITTTNGGVVIRRRPQGPAPPPAHSVHTHSPHHSPVTATSVVTPAAVASIAHTAPVSKSDDTRSPQRLAPANS